MDFIGGGRDGRQQTELKVHFSLSAARVVHNMCRPVCSVQCVLQCVLAGVNVCRRQVVLPRHGSVISARLVPAPNPAHRMPTLYNTAALTIVRGIVHRASAGVQLGVGELVSALAAPSPLIAGGRTP